jgi:membrane protease YdiL (CAAX protease family)
MEKKQVVLDVLFFLGFVLAGLFLAQFLSVVTLLPWHGFDVNMLMQKLNNPFQHPEMKIQLLVMQGFSSFFAFVLAPILYIKWKEKDWRSFLYRHFAFDTILILLTVALALFSMPFTSLLVEWNESLQLPSYLSDFEIWAKEKEDFLKKVTELLTDLNTQAELLMGLLVIAFLPALGEELLFRGYLQNKFQQLFASFHVAIWVSAFFFSAIHMQFYGFVPRMVLGAMFGYLYYFTGQFHLAVLAHFVNNGFMLVMIYLKTKGYTSFDIESEEQVPILLSFVSLLVSVGIYLLVLRRVHLRKTES